MYIFPVDLRAFPLASPSYLTRSSLIVFHSQKMGLNVLNKDKKLLVIRFPPLTLAKLETAK
jgi:hypothetical protein